MCDARNPEGDIELLITGLRPGEKLYEELLIGDNAMPTAHPRVMKAHEACPPWAELAQQIDALGVLLERNDVPAIKCKLQQLLGGYRPHAEVVDWVHMELERQSDALPKPTPAGPDSVALGAAVPAPVLASI